MKKDEIEELKELLKQEENSINLGDLITVEIDQSGEPRLALSTEIDDFERYIESLIYSDD